jgi:hypothetical protein
MRQHTRLLAALTATTLVTLALGTPVALAKPTKIPPKVEATPSPAITPAPTNPTAAPEVGEVRQRKSLAGLFDGMGTNSRWDGYLGVTARSMTLLDTATFVPSLRIGTAWNGMGLLGVTGSWLQQKILYNDDADRPLTLNEYGVYAGWTFLPDWYANFSLIGAYRKAAPAIKGSNTAGRIAIIEPALLVDVNVTETFRVGFEYGMRMISGSVPSEIATSDLGPSYMGLTLTFLGQ